MRRWGTSVPEFVEPYGRPDMIKFLKMIENEDGATAIEYGLIAALIAVAAIGAMTSIGTQLSATFSGVADELDTAAAAPAP